MKKFRLKNSFMNRINLSKIFALMILIVVCVNLTSSPSHVNSDYYRLRIIANSDSFIDQTIKYEIRDKVITLTSSDLKDKKTKRAAKEYITENLKIIEEEAKKIVSSYGKDYDIKLVQGNVLFPDKYYGNQLYSAGRYDALKIELGDAKGKNWWCVMYPPLCIVAFENDEVEDGEVEYRSFIVDKYLEFKEDHKNEQEKKNNSD